MSCFVMDTKSLATIADGIYMISSYGFEYAGIDPPPPLLDTLKNMGVLQRGVIDANKVYKALYRLNMMAYCGRYRVQAELEAPKTNMEKCSIFHCKKSIAPTDYIDSWHDELMPWHYHFLKLLDCWLYQTNEDATRNDPLRRAVQELRDAWQCYLVTSMPEYIAQAWGQ